MKNLRNDQDPRVALPAPGASQSALVLRAGTVLLSGVLLSAPAWAELSDTVHPFVSVALNHDDNLFRLSDDTIGNVEHGSDTFRSLIAGASFERPVGRQLLTGMAKFSRVSFEHNDQLDYTGKDLNGDWGWFLGNHLDGHVGAAYSEVLAPFSDFSVTSERNLRKVRREYADGNWRYHPSWRLRAGYNRERYTYELRSQRQNDRTETSVMTGIDYLAASGSTIGVQLRRLKGSYPFQETLGFSDNGYTQDEQKLNILWLVSGATQVNFLGGFVQRKHDFFRARDDRGTNGRLIVGTAPTQQVKLNAQLYREYGATEGAFVNSALIKGIALGATWAATAKIDATANYKHEKRDFAPYSLSGVLLSPSQLSDTSNLVSAGVTYRPWRNLSLQANVFRDRRSGSVAAGTSSYTANGASINATLQF
ncbi:hypothetical protein NHH73_23530 [Oxalobacteraceae bacterium OTU3CINTB1]|nr:hypothetical protein NHH73_23530 [Oxalobacteraceae bacterium OTU3CINTB1]